MKIKNFLIRKIQQNRDVPKYQVLVFLFSFYIVHTIDCILSWTAIKNIPEIIEANPILLSLFHCEKLGILIPFILMVYILLYCLILFLYKRNSFVALLSSMGCFFLILIVHIKNWIIIINELIR